MPPSQDFNMLELYQPSHHECAAGKGAHQTPAGQTSTTLLCNACKLVYYCSKECQISDWPQHKMMCKSNLMKPIYTPGYIREKRRPQKISRNSMPQYLIGNMPAIDILKLSDNEDSDDVHLDRDYNLLFAASGDLRNIVKTIVGLPKGYKGQCTVVLNDRNFNVVARNIILLFTALSFGHIDAVPIMIHLWYSAIIPGPALKMLQDVFLPRIKTICDNLSRAPEIQDTTLVGKTFTFDNKSATLRVALQKAHWYRLENFLIVPAGLTLDLAHQNRRAVTLDAKENDTIDQWYYISLPALRALNQKYREDGVLLPYGSSRELFDTPNPTFFQDNNTWPLAIDDDPLKGWKYKDIVPENSQDMYAGLFFHLRELLDKFCARVAKGKIGFHAYNVDATNIGEIVNLDMAQLGGSTLLYDRIEVSNICDMQYLGPVTTVSTFTRLLKPRSISSHATLLMLFMNVVPQAWVSSGGATAHKLEIHYLLVDAGIVRTAALNQFSGVCDSTNPKLSNPERIYRELMAKTMFCNLEDLFHGFVEEKDLRNEAIRAGGRIKEKNTIVQQWPCRITKSSTHADIDKNLAMRFSSQERYMEIERVSEEEQGI